MSVHVDVEIFELFGEISGVEGQFHGHIVNKKDGSTVQNNIPVMGVSVINQVIVSFICLLSFVRFVHKK